VTRSSSIAEHEAGAVRLGDGRSLAWQATGPSTAPVVLYLHGSTGSRRTAPASPGVRVLAYDRPGYGASSPHPQRTLVGDAADVRALLDALDLAGVAVLAFSGGAAVGYACAALLGEQVRCLGVVSGAPWPSAPPPPASALNAAADTLAADPAAAVTGLSRGAPRVDAGVLADAAVARRLLHGVRDAVTQGTQGWVDEALLVRSTWPFTPADVRCPVLLWHGEYDAAVPLRQAVVAAQQLPDARWQQVIAGAGHLGWIEQELHVLATLAGTS
jgi:pimeloyl-ACP methyl ester carboxylesterase